MQEVREYTEAERQAALTALIASGGKLRQTARKQGIDPHTLFSWRESAIAAGAKIPRNSPIKMDHERLWANAGAAAARLVRSAIAEQAKHPETLTPAGIQSIAIAGGIATDKHLDYRDGRKGAIQIDQSQHLTLPPGTTLADLESLRAGLTQLPPGGTDAVS